MFINFDQFQHDRNYCNVTMLETKEMKFIFTATKNGFMTTKDLLTLGVCDCDGVIHVKKAGKIEIPQRTHRCLMWRRSNL